MIAKKHRLTENEVKKVLAKRKPFFSHTLVANVFPNRFGYTRVGIVLSGKQTRGSVNRNTWRRMIYDLSLPYLETSSLDVVFVCKKGIVLDSKNIPQKGDIVRDVEYIWGKVK
jgi:ribonuclease P protein component